MESLVPVSDYEHAVFPPWEEKDGMSVCLQRLLHVLRRFAWIFPVVLVRLFLDLCLVGGRTAVELFDGDNYPDQSTKLDK